MGPRRRAAVACLRRFGIALRLRALVGALVGLLLALERRRIAHPKGLGLRRFSRRYYTRDFRPAKWDSGVSLQGSNSGPLMSALCQKRKCARYAGSPTDRTASVNAAVSEGTAPTAAHCRLMLNDGCNSIRRAAAAFASSTRPRRASAATRPI